MYFKFKKKKPLRTDHDTPEISVHKMSKSGNRVREIRDLQVCVKPLAPSSLYFREEHCVHICFS